MELEGLREMSKVSFFETFILPDMVELEGTL